MSITVWFFVIWLVAAILTMLLDFSNQGEDTGAKISRDLVIVGLIIYILSILI